jgi:hypothetical protein
MRREHRGDGQARDRCIEVVVAATQAAQSPDRITDRVVEDPIACGALASTECPHAPVGLREVHETEVERECTDHRFRVTEIEPAQVVVQPRSLRRIVIPTKCDRPATDPLDEREELRAGLFGDHLAKERAEQPNLHGQRVTCTGRSDPARFGRNGRRCAIGA